MFLDSIVSKQIHQCVKYACLYHYGAMLSVCDGINTHGCHWMDLQSLPLLANIVLCTDSLGPPLSQYTSQIAIWLSVYGLININAVLDSLCYTLYMIEKNPFKFDNYDVHK